ncbi:hypothetical protein [Flavobacterium sp.]|uniref:hypothetical protein n=1 Tax=Flavobacterium sp. TaxID=239 RepID=UPI002B4AE8A2|nr:hypothetical protein [Flavobacterium sp.]HLF51427.1 hypothetical protein [Flavobacterium sp.]
MSAQLVIDHIVEERGINLNTLTDKDFSQFNWLNEREPIYNMKGQKVSKSYYFANKKEAIRIVYERLFGDHEYEGIVYPNTFIGVKSNMHWIDWAGEIGASKAMQPYYFRLEPVFNRVDENTVKITFSSQKQRAILKSERYSADDYLQAQNPDLYALLYARYTSDYEFYLKTGKKEKLVLAMNSETNPDINAVFDNEVFGYEPRTVKELILMNLQ